MTDDMMEDGKLLANLPKRSRSSRGCGLAVSVTGAFADDGGGLLVLLAPLSAVANAFEPTSAEIPETTCVESAASVCCRCNASTQAYPVTRMLTAATSAVSTVGSRLRRSRGSGRGWGRRSW